MKKKIAKKAVKAKAVASKKVAPKKVAKKAKPAASKKSKPAAKKSTPVAKKNKTAAKKSAPVAKKIKTIAKKVSPVRNKAGKKLVKVKPKKELKKIMKKPASKNVKPEVKKTPVAAAKKPTPVAKPAAAPEKVEPKKVMSDKVSKVADVNEKKNYSDKELAEFRALIVGKLEQARKDYDLLKNTLCHTDDHGTDDTSPTFKALEDGSDVLTREETAQLALRQEKFIQNLQNALVRIQNKTYGICRVTGKLIPKERLMRVPHATLSIDAKMVQQFNQ